MKKYLLAHRQIGLFGPTYTRGQKSQTQWQKFCFFNDFCFYSYFFGRHSYGKTANAMKRASFERPSCFGSFFSPPHFSSGDSRHNPNSHYPRGGRPGGTMAPFRIRASRPLSGPRPAVPAPPRSVRRFERGLAWRQRRRSLPHRRFVCRCFEIRAVVRLMLCAHFCQPPFSTGSPLPNSTSPKKEREPHLLFATAD